jgi:hypothetical protein
VPATPATHPEPRISLQTPGKIRNSPKAHPRARGKVTHDKNPKQKIPQPPPPPPRKELIVWSMGRNVVMRLLNRK